MGDDGATRGQLHRQEAHGVFHQLLESLYIPHANRFGD